MTHRRDRRVVGSCASLCLLFVAQAAAQDTFTLELVPAAEGQAIAFELSQSGAQRMAEGILYEGEAAVISPGGCIVLAGSTLWFGFAPGTDRVQSVRGRAFVPKPLSTQPVNIPEPVMAELGFDLGVNLKSYGVPLQDNRGYLFFRFDAGLKIVVGKEQSDNLEEADGTSFTLAFPAGAQSTILFDPLDPMFYFGGGVVTPRGSKPDSGQGSGGSGGAQEEGSDVTIGAGHSIQGLIPFRPLVTYAIEDKARDFNGHRIRTGSFPLFNLPVFVQGHMITNLDPLATGDKAIDPFGIGFGPVVQAGANGKFTFSMDFLKVAKLGNIANLSVPLGRATAAVEIVRDLQHAYISGIVDPNYQMPLPTLLKHEGELKAAALLSTNIGDSRVRMDGRYIVSGGELSRLVGLNLGNLIYMQGSLSADRTGLVVLGRSEAGLTLGPVYFANRVGTEFRIPASDPDNFFLQMNGLMALNGLGTDGTARFASRSISFSGRLTGPSFDMRTTGGVSVEQAGAFLWGSMTVPPQLQPNVTTEIRREAARVQQEIDGALSEYQRATKDYEFELSLRGMRTVIPPVTDAIIREIDSAIVSNLNARWPSVKTWFGTVEAPGKSAALSLAHSVAEPYRQRLRELKRLMQTGDNATVRAALKAAINQVLANTRLRITYQVPVVNVTITIYDQQIISAGLQSQLRTALSAIDLLPEKSNIMISARSVWERLPKREILRATAKAIEQGAGAMVPRIESIGFRFPVYQPTWQFNVDIAHNNTRLRGTVNLNPANIAQIGSAIGRVLAESLN